MTFWVWGGGGIRVGVRLPATVCWMEKVQFVTRNDTWNWEGVRVRVRFRVS